VKRWISKDGTPHLTPSAARLHSQQLAAAEQPRPEPLQRAAPITTTKMRLYGTIQKIEPLDDGSLRVFGIASSESVDDQNEVVRADAMRAAIPDYLKFPALREMHGLSAAGSTTEIGVDDDGVTRIVCHVVDPVAILKVRSQTYRGFSIGGKVTQRDPDNCRIVTGIALQEISLVDRPSNPDAIFNCWKVVAATDLEKEMKTTPRQASNEATLAAIDRDLRQLQGDPATVLKRRAEDAGRTPPPLTGEQGFIAAVKAQRVMATDRAKQPAVRYAFENWLIARAG
jgi:hypothetical protein